MLFLFPPIDAPVSRHHAIGHDEHTGASPPSAAGRSGMPHSEPALLFPAGASPFLRRATRASLVGFHKSLFSFSAGVSFICGGKWSTYRAMAEELIDKVAEIPRDYPRLPEITRDYPR